MTSAVELIDRLYDRFNARDIEAVLAMLHPEVIWANGMEGGQVLRRDGVREYRMRQWAVIDPRVTPIAVTAGSDGTILVEVQQAVRDLAGKVLSERAVGHVFRIESRLIRRFDILKASVGASARGRPSYCRRRADRARARGIGAAPTPSSSSSPS
jgi:hypothetical protein